MDRYARRVFTVAAFLSGILAGWRGCICAVGIRPAG